MARFIATVLRLIAQRLDGPIQVEVHVHLDGKEIARMVNLHNYREMARGRASRQ